jgi:hypothetical protein
MLWRPGALIMGLWNQLTRHQKRSAPFRLTRPDVAATREGLATLALIRRQELDGFRPFVQACTAGYAGLAAGKKADPALTRGTIR